MKVTNQKAAAKYMETGNFGNKNQNAYEYSEPVLQDQSINLPLQTSNPYKQEVTHVAQHSEDGYYSFLNKYNIDNSLSQDPPTATEIDGLNQVQSYSNLIERQKMEHNLSFSNNGLQDDELQSSGQMSLKNLDDIDIDYDRYAQQQPQQMPKNDHFNDTEPVQIIGKALRLTFTYFEFRRQS